MEENMVRSFTGHIILVSKEETKDNVLFTPMAKPLKILPDYPKIKSVLEKQDFIQAFLPMTRGGVAILGGQGMDFMLAFGCNFDDYQRVFGSPITPVEGQLLKNGDHGLLVNVEGRKNHYKAEGFWLVPEGHSLVPASLTDDAKKEGDKLDVRTSLALEGFGEPNSTNKVVPIKGVVKFKSLNTAMAEVSIMDIESFREIFGYYTARDVVESLPPRETALMGASEDAMFNDADIYSTGGGGANVTELEQKIKTPVKVTRVIDFDSAAYNYVSILLKPGNDLNRSVERLKKIAKDNDLPVKVLSWKTASGQVAQTADIMQMIINVFVILLFIVAIIIIMNTLSMNALERTEEFGMMRAVGAQKHFITRMFLWETISLASIFGGAGIVLGVVATWVARLAHLGAGGSQVWELVFGGEVFKPALGPSGIITGIIGLGVVTVLAVLYPVAVARKITPLDAINRH